MRSELHFPQSPSRAAAAGGVAAPSYDDPFAGRITDDPFAEPAAARDPFAGTRATMRSSPLGHIWGTAACSSKRPGHRSSCWAPEQRLPQRSSQRLLLMPRHVRVSVRFTVACRARAGAGAHPTRAAPQPAQLRRVRVCRRRRRQRRRGKLPACVERWRTQCCCMQCDLCAAVSQRLMSSCRDLALRRPAIPAMNPLGAACPTLRIHP